MSAAVTLLVGTTKGLFLLSSDEDRARYAAVCDVWAINARVLFPHRPDLAAGLELNCAILQPETE